MKFLLIFMVEEIQNLNYYFLKFKIEPFKCSFYFIRNDWFV